MAKTTLPISVIIPSLGNNLTFLKESIDSILISNFIPEKIIVIDDSGLKKIEQFINDLYPKGIVIVHNNESNLGACLSRNVGINLCESKYITFLDDDDEYVDDRLKILYDFSEENNSFSIVGSGNIILNHSTKNAVKENKFLGKSINKQEILCGNYFGASALIRTVYLKTKNFDKKLIASQDHDLFTQVILEFGNGYKMNNHLYISRQHNDGERVSSNAAVGLIQYWLKYRHIMSLKTKLFNFIKIIFYIIK